MTEVVTGDAIVLEVSAAAFPSRMAARLIDMIVQLAVLIPTLIVIFATSSGSASGAALAAMTTVAIALVIVGYPAIFETLSRGKTLGKMAMGLRVVADDGGPVRFRQALVRALAGIFEIWTFILTPVALITSMLSARGKRLGDMFAGTYVVQERVPLRRNLAPEFAMVPPPLAGWATQLELSGLSDRDAEAAGSYLRRFYELQPAARDALGFQLAATIAAHVSPPPPPGTPPAAYLAAVLTVRRQRDYLRLAGGPGAQGAGPSAASPPGASTPAATAPLTSQAGPPAGGAPAGGAPAAQPGGHAPPR